MGWRDIDIGAVSAYAIAVEHGYTGTEEEWANEQAAAGTNARIAKESAETAVAAAKSAQSNLDSIKPNTEQAITDIQTEGSTQRRSVTSTGDAQNQRVMDTGAEQSRALDAQGATERQKVVAAGDEQVSRVTNVGNDAVESVTLEKTEAVNSVETAKTSAVEAVKSAESAAIQNIGTGVDDTLSISGKAADAKKTGDAISSLKDDLSDQRKEMVKFVIGDMANSWWCNPRAIYRQATGMTYVTGVTSQGLCGIGVFDNTLNKTDFVRLSYTYKDDHNAPAILIEDDKPPIVAYTGHAQYNYVRVRVGDAPYDVKSLEFKSDTEVAFTNEEHKCTYASLIRITGTSKVILFTRLGMAIYYRVSENWGLSWGKQKLFCSPYYYMTFKISTDGYAKIAVSKHPITHHSAGIYYFRLRLSDGALVGRSGADLGNILSDSFDGIDLDNNTNVIKVHVTNWEQDTVGVRLLDIGDSAHILAVKLDYTNPSVGGTYGVYDPSSQDGWNWTPIVPTGLPVGYYQSAYIGGGCFDHTSIGDASVFITREDEGTWFTERWQLSGSTWVKNKDIEMSEQKTGRPQIPWGDYNRKLALINYRYYDDADFTKYFGDEKLISF